MYCRNCGKEVNENDKFCPNCGSQTHDDGFESAKRTVKEQFDNITDTEDYTSHCDEQDISDNKILSLFAYLGIFILVPLFAGKDSKFAKFHVAQGVNLIIAEVAYSVITAIVTFAFSWVPFVAGLFEFLVGILGILLTVLAIIGIINAVTGKAKELPIIGKWKIVNYETINVE